MKLANDLYLEIVDHVLHLRLYLCKSLLYQFFKSFCVHLALFICDLILSQSIFIRSKRLRLVYSSRQSLSWLRNVCLEAESFILEVLWRYTVCNCVLARCCYRCALFVLTALELPGEGLYRLVVTLSPLEDFLRRLAQIIYHNVARACSNRYCVSIATECYRLKLTLRHYSFDCRSLLNIKKANGLIVRH